MPVTLNVGSRSVFVTLTAWIAIVLALFAGAWTLLQNAALAGVAPTLPPLAPAASLRGLVGSLMVEWLPWLLGAALAVSLATLASAVGLLMRLEWARRAFIAMLVVVLVANLAGLWLQQELLQAVAAGALQRVPLPPAAVGVFGGFVAAARVTAVVVTLGGCLLLAWAARRLASPAVRQEFA